MEVKKVSPSATTALIVVAFFLITLTNASAGTEKVLANFPGAHGGLQPWAGLVSDAAGNFYGVTYYGGPNGKGEVFRVHYSAATGWSECTAYGFKGGKDGANPYGGLIFDSGRQSLWHHFRRRLLRRRHRLQANPYQWLQLDQHRALSIR